jgi:hypothetical protein
MNHRTARQLAALAAGDDLSPGDREALEAHLSGCPSCAAEARHLARSRRVVQQLSGELDSLGPPPAVAPRGPVPTRLHRRLMPIAALVGVALLGIWWGTGRWSDPDARSGRPEPVHTSPTLVRMRLAPGTAGVQWIVLGPLPPPRQVCSTRVQPLPPPAAAPVTPPAPRPPVLAAEPRPVARGEGARARAVVIPGGLRMQPAIQLTHGDDDSSWMVCEVP